VRRPRDGRLQGGEGGREGREGREEDVRIKKKENENEFSRKSAEEERIKEEKRIKHGQESGGKGEGSEMLFRPFFIPVIEFTLNFYFHYCYL
jgi:hypothetical protein